MSTRTQTFDEFKPINTDEVMTKLNDLNNGDMYEMEVNSKTKPTAFPSNATRTAVNTVEIKDGFNMYNVLPHEIIGDVDVMIKDNHVRFEYEAKGYSFVIVEIRNVTKPFTQEQKASNISILESKLSDIDKVNSVEMHESFGCKRLEIEVEHINQYYGEIEINYHLNKVVMPIKSILNNCGSMFDNIEVITPDKEQSWYNNNLYNNATVTVYFDE